MGAHDVLNSAPGANANGVVVRGAGTFSTTTGPGAATTGATTYTAATGAVQTVWAANTSRRGGTIYNDHATNNLYVKLGAAAATNSFTVKMVAGSYYEIPAGYTGIVTAIMSAASGNIAATEIT